jgi:hypothetical protein
MKNREEIQLLERLADSRLLNRSEAYLAVTYASQLRNKLPYDIEKIKRFIKRYRGLIE